MDGIFDNETESTITINEYLEEVEAEELEADLVLGGDEGKECTYGKGYMKRQAIFSCQTCTPEGNAGICTACSLACHDGHEIVELWTKRNFRCDCGNSKFGDSFCKLLPLKDVENTENSYNHNFKGKYCTCDRVYPDPSTEDQQEMIQCTICEDWFHEEHIGLDSTAVIPKDEEGEPIYEDFICNNCSSSCSFLKRYPNKIWAVSGQIDNNEANPDEEACIIKVITEEGSNSSSISQGCPYTSDGSNPAVLDDGKPMFLAKGWRDALCRCEGCLKMYETKRMSYLVLKEDSIAEYEKCAKKKRAENVDEMSYLNGLSHVEKMELLNGMADFKEEFRSFLESFDSSKAITSSDIHKIFDNLAKKRKRLE